MPGLTFELGWTTPASVVRRSSWAAVGSSGEPFDATSTRAASTGVPDSSTTLMFTRWPVGNIRVPRSRSFEILRFSNMYISTVPSRSVMVSPLVSLNWATVNL